MGWGGVGMLTLGWSWTRHWCYAEHRVGWGGVGMLTFVWSWTRHWCYAEHGVGWGWVGWGWDVDVRLKLNTPLMLRWGWGGDVNVRLKLNTPLMLRWAWGGVGMWTFVWSWTRHWCYAGHGVGWVGVGWGGDVNVRLKLNTPLMLRWAWGGVGWGGVGMLTFVWSWTRHWCYAEHGVGWCGVGMLTFAWSWTRYWCTGLHAQWSLKLARQKKVRISCGRVAKRKKNDLFLKWFLLRDGYETLKGVSFFDHGDAPTRAIPHPAGCLSGWCFGTFLFSIYWEFHNPNWRSHIVRGVGKPPTSYMFILYYRPSGKHTKNMENHHFQWVNQLYISTVHFLYSKLFVYRRVYVPNHRENSNFLTFLQVAELRANVTELQSQLPYERAVGPRNISPQLAAVQPQVGAARRKVRQWGLVTLIYIYILCMSNI